VLVPVANGAIVGITGVSSVMYDAYYGGIRQIWHTHILSATL
jgi:hypothetical protein